MILKQIIIILLINFAVNAIKKDFTGYKLYKVVPKNNDEVEIIKQLDKNNIIYEVLDYFYSVGSSVKAIIAEENENTFVETTNKFNTPATVVIDDLGKFITSQLQKSHLSGRTETSLFSFNWESYHTLEEINQWLDELQENYPNVVTTVVMGQSFNGRDIKGVRLNFKPDQNVTRIGMLEGALHAREWISPATVTWILKEFLTSTDPDVRALAENFEWHIFPVVNPDGYSYTFTDNRLWRKNRNTNYYTTCPATEDDMSNGVDLNRNFDYFWLTIDTINGNDSCTNTFAGAYPVSEPETEAISNYVQNLKERGELVYYIAFHSYSQLIIMPYSHVDSVEVMQAANYGDLYEIGVRSGAKIRERFGTEYRVGISANVMYPMAGTSFDWVKYNLSVPIVYLIELRDRGQYGFLLPEDQIIPNNLEIMDGFLEMDKTVRGLGYYVRDGASSVAASLVLLVLTFVITVFY